MVDIDTRCCLRLEVSEELFVIGKVSRRIKFSSKQKDFYEQTARPLVDSVLEGFNGTIFAYGQTGTGKTFTMEGIRSQPELRGIIPSSFAHIFQSIKKSESRQFLVRASYLEIYNVNMIDFLNELKRRRFF